ncbi:MAG TPA: EAL domain-containing protein [Solirubrobacteraceae bacterium]
MGRVNAYVATVIAAGLAAIAYVATGDPFAGFHRNAPLLITLVLGTAVGEMLPIKVVLRRAEGEIVLSTTFAFAMLLAFGPATACVGLAAASVVADCLRRKAPAKIAFNAAQYALTILASGAVLALLTGVPRPGAHPFVNGDLVGIMAAAAAFYAVNTLIVATVMALVEEIGVWRYLTRDFVVQASSAGLLLGLSPILVIVGTFGLTALPLLALPLVAIYRGERQALAKEHQALHDALTGLPNRTLFHERVTAAISSGARGRHAVMLMDVDHFKEVNDTLGHHHGDELLREIAARLAKAVRPEDTVARLGGDEFAVLVPDLDRDETAVAVAERLLRTLQDPLHIEGLSLEVTASIGIATHPAHGDRVELLLRHADVAMYEAKRGHTGHQVYRPENDRHSTHRLTLAAELRKAIDEGELELHFQPQADLATGAVRGVEALVRWRHPSRGLIAPGDFIPLAERSGLIAPLTSFVLDQALGQASRWRDSGLVLPIAVNLSARSFLDHELPAEIAALLSKWGTDAELLQLEITESMLMSDPDRARTVLERLTRQGLRLSIDDFGTGYSSLAQLKRLPVDEIKIDRSFVIDMGSSANDEAIVRSTIELAHNLGLSVVAEGVEDEASLRALRRLGCDLAQGFHLGRPLPAESLTPLLGGVSLRRVA